MSHAVSTNLSPTVRDQAISDRHCGTLTIEEAAQVLGISRYLAYQEARTGYLAGVKVLRIGRRMIVPRVALESVLSGQEAAAR